MLWLVGGKRQQTIGREWFYTCGHPKLKSLVFLSCEMFALFAENENIRDQRVKKQIAGRTEHRRKCLWYVKPLRLQRRDDAVVKNLLDADGFLCHSKGRHTAITLPTPPLNATWSACLDRRLWWSIFVIQSERILTYKCPTGAPVKKKKKKKMKTQSLWAWFPRHTCCKLLALLCRSENL